MHRAYLVAEVLSRRLSDEPLLQTVSATSDLKGALGRLDEVDVVMVDGSARLASGVGFAAAVLTVPDHPLVLVVAEGGDPLPLLHAGARGWVTVDKTAEVLVEAILAVCRGELWLPTRVYPEVVAQLIKGATRPSRLAGLTGRQLMVLQDMVDGRSSRDSAAMMYISANTLRTHRARLFAKLRVHSSLEAVAVAREAGLTPSP